MTRLSSNYDKRPSIEVSTRTEDCSCGWQEIGDRIAGAVASTGARRIAVECYPGTDAAHICEQLRSRLTPSLVVLADDALKPAPEIDAMVGPCLTDDPVFGWMKPWRLEEFFSTGKMESISQVLRRADGLALVIGTGASLLAPDADLLIYVDCPRWELQQRQRRGTIANLGAAESGLTSAQRYKRAYFVDWRAADAQKLAIVDRIDFYLDQHDSENRSPLLISGVSYRAATRIACTRPFRVVPFFDPGPWGGQWMRDHFDLPDGPPNYAWCFDCVPEENSVLFRFGDRTIESPALGIVQQHPEELLGKLVHQRFGAEFPIRFDFLDTVGGGNLSLQVHPLASYIQSTFGMAYTQDESYYILDAEPDALVYLGLRNDIKAREMEMDLRLAQTAGGPSFYAGKHVQAWPARKHDHFSIPAGTVHCSGRNTLVLEVSATPYIFTFKLWDWDRMGLDGKPRPIHLDHGLKNIQWDRTTEWVGKNLVNPVRQFAEGNGWYEEVTGLHDLEFIETRRHWFTEQVPHDTQGNLNVLNLVEGIAAVVASPTGAFEDFIVHYAETFIVPAAVGKYTVGPLSPSSKPLATLKAYIRDKSL